MTELLGISVASLVAAIVLTGFVRRRALESNLLDIPNARSSHVRPTPRGGGIAIVITSLVALGVLSFLGHIQAPLFYALAGGGAAIALVGYLDDRGRIGVAARFAVHFAAAIWAIAWVGWPTTVQWGEGAVHIGAAGSLLSVLAIVWALNLFNFMDGIDGIAASQAVFMASAGSLLALVGGLGPGVPAAGLVLASATAGFLVWNWPPARIFMGDVGSGFLGFVLAVLALSATRERADMLAVWLILGGIFFIDATLTLCRRLIRRERVYEAHRSHAYQWLARRWNSHRRVTVACLVLNALWLAPWAWACIRYPEHAGWCVAAAWAPLIVLAAISGAGRSEASVSQVGR